MLSRDANAPYYTLNCVNDLDEGDEEMVSERVSEQLGSSLTAASACELAGVAQRALHQDPPLRLHLRGAPR